MTRDIDIYAIAPGLYDEPEPIPDLLPDLTAEQVRLAGYLVRSQANVELSRMGCRFEILHEYDYPGLTVVAFMRSQKCFEKSAVRRFAGTTEAELTDLQALWDCGARHVVVDRISRRWRSTTTGERTWDTATMW